MMQTKYLIANFKMNGNIDQLTSIVKQSIILNSEQCRVIVCPPSIYIYPVKIAIGEVGISIGSQDVSKFSNGSYTGDVSCSMLQDIGVCYCIIGHSERRKNYCESNDQIKAKIKQLTQNSIIPILCVGEELDIRNKNQHEEYIVEQIKAAEVLNLDKLIIAYEPIWSIGTGVIPTNEQIDQIAKTIKSITYDRFPVIYGGSVGRNNVDTLVKCRQISGFLVGAASLNFDEFKYIYDKLLLF